jgi:AraC-like DNA-binding protein
MAATTSSTLPVFFRHRAASRFLSEFVSLFWYYRGHDVVRSKERVLPTGTTELVINLGDRGYGVIAGPQSESFIIERRSADELLGVHFHPGGAFPFLQFPSGELRDLQVSITDVWGEQKAAELLCRLHDANDIEAKFQILERWLMAIASRPLKHNPAVSFAMTEFQKDPGVLSSAGMAERVGYSQRHFIDLFHHEVGFTPKLFCRVQRFRSVIDAVQKLDDVDWTDIALSCGYFDQSHFNHEFRRFSGLSPTDYLALRTPHINHVQEPG